MRVGLNPHKDLPHNPEDFLHQVVIPVFIPHFEGYFKDAFAILRHCLDSIKATVHDKTYITVVNNGSCHVIADFLQQQLLEGKIHEIIHTTNVGKLNAILKGVTGHNMELVTICDSDTLFLPGWQQATTEIFSKIPKAGIVGLVPQIRMFRNAAGPVIADNLFTDKLQFVEIPDPEALMQFHDSLGWDRNYPDSLSRLSLGLKWSDDLTVLVGSGHFVSTYKRDIFDTLVSFIPFKMGGWSEHYLDNKLLERGYWRLTTLRNYARHMGNVLDPQVADVPFSSRVDPPIVSGFPKSAIVSKHSMLLKSRLVYKLLSSKLVFRWFAKRTKLPPREISVFYGR